MAKDSKENILETTFILFMQKSFKAVTMNDIVKRSGMSKGAFYHYFTSKEEVFEEVVETYFMKLMDIDYSGFSHESLKAFYTDLVNSLQHQSGFVSQIRKAKETGGALNYFQLLFDAISISPALKDKILEVQAKEMKAWTQMIGIARKNGEIRTDLADKDVAKLFIYVNDGGAMNGVMRNRVEGSLKEIMTIYNCLYELLKV